MHRQSLAFPYLLLLTLAVAPGCDAIHLIGGKQASRAVQYVMPLPASGKCVVRTRNGRINCVAGNVSEIVIKAEIKANAATLAKAEEAAKLITVERTDNDGAARIEANVPRGTYGSVSLTLIVPADLQLDLETTNGAVNVVDMTGAIELETTNGRVAIIGAELAHVTAETTNGSVHLEGILQPGEHELETTNGSIHVELSGTPVTVEGSTRNGHITANGQRLNKDSSVTLGSDDEQEADAHLTAETTNGSITITHAPSANALPTEAAESQL